MTTGPVVLGVDIGTTSTKVVAYGSDLRARASASAGYPLSEPRPGWAEQDPEAIWRAVLLAVGEVVAATPAPVAGLSFSTAMHSLVGLDAGGRPLTSSLTWADTRAAAQAERLRAAPGGPALHRRTGTPVHPMSPLPKLVWFAEHEPALAARVAHWVAVKDLVLLRLCGRLVTDHSTASATGLMDLSLAAWDPQALALAGVTAAQLPELVPTTAVLRGLTAAADGIGLPRHTPVVVGAGDGPLANLGLGAIRPGVAAVSIGTSGAVRVTVEQPSVDPLGGVFCYALSEDRWVVGGAVNNGGVVLGWAGDALAPDLGDRSEQELLALAATAPAGCDGLVMLPYLLGERAPHWTGRPLGAYVGLRVEHRRRHLVRAALEGVCQQLALVLAAVRAAGHEVREVRATGGFARSPFWRQLLADVLDLPVGFPAGHEGSSLGAALLGRHALGLLGSLDEAADLVQVAQVVRPDPGAAATYRALRPVFTQLWSALEPSSAQLRDLTPM